MLILLQLCSVNWLIGQYRINQKQCFGASHDINMDDCNDNSKIVLGFDDISKFKLNCICQTIYIIN